MRAFAVSTATLIVLLASVSSTSLAIEHTKDSLATIKQNVTEEKALLIDVRTEEEWKEGHLALAKLLPLSLIQKELPAKELDKTKIIYLHCRSGKRCVTAAEVLAKAGYDARPLKQGYDELVKNGFSKAEQDQPK